MLMFNNGEDKIRRIEYFAHFIFRYNIYLNYSTFHLCGKTALFIYCLGSNISPCGVIAATVLPGAPVCAATF